MIGARLRLASVAMRRVLRPALDLRFVGVSALDSRVTFTRASQALDDVSGSLVAFAENVARLSTVNGLGIFEARTTKPLYSRVRTEVLTNVLASVPASASIVAVTNPASGLSVGGGNVLQIDNSAGGSPVTIQFLGTMGNTSAHSMQMYARRVSGSPSTFQLEGSVNTTSISSTSFARLRNENRTPSASGNRLEATVPAGAVAQFAAWDAQQGAICTPLIDAEGAQKTCSADVAIISGANFTTFFNAAANTFVYEFSPSVTADGFVVFSIDDGTLNNRYSCFNSRPFIVSATANVFTPTASIPASGAVIKDVVAVALNDFAWSRDGGALQTDITGALPVGVDRLQIGRTGTGSLYLNGYARRIRSFKKRFPNAEIQSIALNG